MAKKRLASPPRYGHFPPSAFAPVSHAVQRLHQFAMLKEIAHQEYDERCEYENWDASCLETPPMTVKAPFKMQRYTFTPWSEVLRSCASEDGDMATPAHARSHN